jgi:phosphotriesterase-related protein
MVETARGPVDAGALGLTLPHEHVFIMRPEALQNFGHVWDSVPYWDEEVRVADAIETLTIARAGGIETIVDPTVLGLGRYIPRIQRVNAAVDTDRIHLSMDGACFYDFMAHNPFFADEHPDLLRISKSLLPALRDGGVTEEQIAQMMVGNPRRFLAGA